jgi:hypothetical protein
LALLEIYGKQQLLLASFATLCHVALPVKEHLRHVLYPVLGTYVHPEEQT